MNRFNDYFGEEAIAIYIDATERNSIEKAILTSKTTEIAKDILERLAERFLNIGIGRVLSDMISTILEKAILRKRLEDNYVLVIVDDIAQVVGVEKIEWYVKWLYELLWKLRREYKPKAINFIVTTSEGKSLRLVERHRHAHTAMIWNLDKRSFRELFHKLKPPKSIEFERIWRLLGGNPGKLIELAENYNWNIKRMTLSYSIRLADIVRTIAGQGLTSELKMAIEEPDNIAEITTERMRKLEEILIENNLIMRTGLLLDFSEIRPQPEIGLGKHYAWQIPMYRDIMAKTLRKNHVGTRT